MIGSGTPAASSEGVPTSSPPLFGHFGLLGCLGLLLLERLRPEIPLELPVYDGFRSRILPRREKRLQGWLRDGDPGRTPTGRPLRGWEHRCKPAC